MIKINNLSKKFDEECNIRIKDTAFKDGTSYVLLGPSGCGKSTLLNIISGLLEPSSGEALYNGDNIKEHLNKIGYMFQKDHLFEWYTVWENVTLGLNIKKQLNEKTKKNINNLLETYGLSKFKEHYPSELSGGMRQRVALIRTLALNPEILFLDEPFSALDYQSRLLVCDDVYKIIKHEKKTAIMVTHDIAEAISMSQKIIVLTKRPATVKRKVEITFSVDDLTPFEKRKQPEFSGYFNELWKELNNDD